MTTQTYSVVQLADVLCTVNVQHDCIANACEAEKDVPIRQEGEVTSQLRDRIVHHRNPDQIVLNTAQMCSAKYIQPFRIPHTPKDGTVVILASVQKEIALQNASRRGSRARTPPTSPRLSALQALQPTVRPPSHLSPVPHLSIPPRAVQAANVAAPNRRNVSYPLHTHWQAPRTRPYNGGSPVHEAPAYYPTLHHPFAGTYSHPLPPVGATHPYPSQIFHPNNQPLIAPSFLRLDNLVDSSDGTLFFSDTLDTLFRRR
ncbi:hypothetical protein IW261DRAFT_1572155 [Armillaria novae-zelandiae]|uniref:Velvet domain-containing protein n=1 Tax=Armillaria novae-zelandiae TaxID=153914 RepID=A0AA39NSY4_9AGAR|nr:hypothetical protein IW261DRAFT_1572155 [Armillaria novae-zelandiae]